MVYAASAIDPRSARRVSCKAAMLTRSLDSCSLMTADFRTPSIDSMSQRPGHNVLTFHVPNLKTDIPLGFFLIFFAGVELQLADESNQPYEHASWSGSAPYWLEAAQLRRAVADQ